MRGNKGMWIGVFLLVLGLSFILKAVFHIDLPIFRVLIGLWLMYMGFRMVTGGRCGSGGCAWKSERSAVFSEEKWEENQLGERSGHYNVVFGNGQVDLSSLSADKLLHPLHLNVVFGEGVVYFDPKQSLEVSASSVFGEASLPDGNSVAFGKMSYKSKDAGDAKPVKVFANVVFGSLKFLPKTK